MPGARGARLTQSGAAPTVIQMSTTCPACGARPGVACTSLAPVGEVDQNLTLKPSHYARRFAYFDINQVPNPDIVQGARVDLEPVPDFLGPDA